MATDPTKPHDLDELETHVLEFNRLLFASFSRFESRALIDMITELRHLRQVVEEWSPIVGDYLAKGLSEPVDDSPR